VNPPNGAYGNSARNSLYGPGYGSVDFSVVKNTKVTERVNAQFRIELFNLFNRINLAPPSGTVGTGRRRHRRHHRRLQRRSGHRAGRSFQPATRPEADFLARIGE
jgi:hypothetical protein